jgi:carbon starvation protein
VKERIRPRSILIWTAVALLGAVAWGVLALWRGEEISAVWLLFAAVCSYAIAYRFYAHFIAKKVLGTDDRRATPAERLDNNHDSSPPTGGCCSDTTSRRSPGPVR